MVPDSIFLVTDRAMVTQSVPGAAATETPAALSAALSSLGQGAGAAITTAPGGGTIATGPAATATTCVAAGVTAVSVVSSPPAASMQPRLDVDCDEWAVAPCNIGCQQFANKSGITFQDFRQWNPDVSLASNDECEKFYGGFAYCVGISGNSVLRARDSTGEVLQVNETEVADSVQLLEPWTYFNNWKSAYATSPYLAWTVNKSIDARNPDEWEGLAAATSDLDDLLSLAYSTDNTQPVWDTLMVDSSDWIKLDLDNCRESFSERYRPNTGTVDEEYLYPVSLPFHTASSKRGPGWLHKYRISSSILADRVPKRQLIFVTGGSGLFRRGHKVQFHSTCGGVRCEMQ